MNLQDVFTDKVKLMQPYHVQSSAGMIKLDAMESPYSLPDDMRQALGTILSLSNINRYPNSRSTSLAAKIREAFQLSDALDLIMGNGSDELIQIILMAVAKPDAVVLSPVPSFVMYQQTAELLGMQFVGVDLNDDLSLDQQQFLAAIDAHQPSVIFLAYPNNPTGMLLDKAFIKQVAEKASGIVVIDEAYTAYASDSAADLVTTYENVVTIRTLSKIGLAGIRLGYLLAQPSIAEQFEKVRMPYNISLLTQSTARFMLDQMPYIDECVNKLMAEKATLFEWLSSQPYMTVFPSETNFLLVRFDNANQVFERLRDDYKILVKNLHGYHPVLDNVLRITIGRHEENIKLREALSEILA